MKVKKLFFTVLIGATLTNLPTNCFSQEQKKIKMYIEGGYQLGINKSYYIGIGQGLKMQSKNKFTGTLNAYG